MEDKIKVTIDYLKKKKVDYADIRLQKKLAESIKVKNKNVESISRNEDQGFGIRVINSGSWGFASSSVTTEAEMKRVANKAIQIAKASAITKKENVVLAEQESFVDKYQSFYQLDPFTVPLDRKIELLLNSTQILSKSKKIKVAEGYMGFYKTDKVFASTEGAYITQAILESGAGIFATAVDDGEVQRRSYPGSHTGDFATRGYEFIQEMRFLENAERTREEAIQLLSADPCPDTTTTLIITGPQMALQIHESCGHPTELDRVLGTEISLAGGSFLTLDKLSKLRYGSDKVSITADATVPGGLGTFGYDDEGVKAQRSFLVKDGLFVGYLTSRETAPVLKQKSNGTMRADGWNRIPLIRMTNINLEPGEWELNDLIADTQEGILVDMNKSWSIDDKRLNFQFGTEIAWEIKNGKVGKVYKNPVYTGITPEFWNSCDAVCNRKHWRVWGVPNCGKGEPMQIMHVAHGASPTRFRNIKVGVSK
ncbi:MAG: peptidase C69 [candidate division Zixibacteria bacterium SM23_73_2]|nr:MAG: peptidase C69 [candidate division Zixibacteria bacterium SM23_73_2]